MAPEPLRVLFLCTGNSARSQMAEAILRSLSRGRVNVISAGSTPRDEIHPMARRAVRTLLGLEMTGQHPKPLEPFLESTHDYVITLCDRAQEVCPTLPSDPERMHWRIEDPAVVAGTEMERQRAFDHTAHHLLTRIRLWLSLPSVSQRLTAS